MAEYSLKQIKEAYILKRDWEKQFPINYYIVRPISFYITFFVLKISVNPSAVAFFGFTFGLIGCACLFFLSYMTIYPGLVFIFIYSLFDAVDGNIARTTGKVTLFGIYLDGLIGDLIDSNYFFFLGIGLFFSESVIQNTIISNQMGKHANIIPLLLGSTILIFRLWASNFESRYNAYRIKKEGCFPNQDTRTHSTIQKSKYSSNWLFKIFININCLNNQLLLLIVLAYFHQEIWFLYFFSLFCLVRMILYLIYFYSKTRASLV